MGSGPETPQQSATAVAERDVVIDLRDGAGGAGMDPAEIAKAQVAALTAAAREVRVGVEGWPVEMLAEGVVDMAAARSELDRALLTAVGLVDLHRLPRKDATKSTTGWLKAWTGVSGAVAAAQVRSARHLQAFAVTAAALAAGTITPAQVDVLARAAGQGREVLYREHEEMLIGLAKDAPLLAGLERAVQRWTVMMDAQRMADDPAVRVSSRRLGLALRAFGMLDVHGMIDEHGSPIVVDALEDLAGPDPADRPGGPRTREQRLADALVELARRHLSNRNRGLGQPYTAVDLVLTAELVAQWLREHAGELPTEIVELLNGTISPAEVTENHRPAATLGAGPAICTSHHPAAAARLMPVVTGRWVVRCRWRGSCRWVGWRRRSSGRGQCIRGWPSSCRVIRGGG